jgi:hypothetical protein
MNTYVLLRETRRKGDLIHVHRTGCGCRFRRGGIWCFIQASGLTLLQTSSAYTRRVQDYLPHFVRTHPCAFDPPSSETSP